MPELIIFNFSIMNTNNQTRKVYLFKDEMKNFLQHWKDTPENKDLWWKQKISHYQRRNWPTTKKLTQDMLAKEPDNGHIPLRAENPIMKETWPVGSCKLSQARKYFEDNENMRWPDDLDVIRMGLFFHWGPYRTLNMLLKVTWEKYLKDKAYGIMKYDQGEGLSDFLRNSTKAIEQFSLTFFDDECDRELTDFWFDEFMYHDIDGFNNNEHFELLVKEYCNNKLFLRSINDPVWDEFIADKEQEKKQASEEYWNYKTIWAAREGDLEQVIFDYGQAKLNYRFLTNKWYNQFGEDYMKAKKLMFTNKVLQNRILLKSENPGISEEQMAEEEFKNFYFLQKEFQKEAQRTQEAVGFQEARKVPVSQQFANDYHQACKKLLKRIWRLTHPDSYQLEGFTDKQVEVLDEKFEQSIEINERIAIKGSDDFDLQELNNLLSEVKNIWETIGKDIPDYDAVIGKDTPEKIAWLKNRVAFLEKQIEQMQLRVKAVETHADYLEKKESLANDSNINQTHKAFTDQIKMLEDLNSELVEQCEKMEINTDVQF